MRSLSHSARPLGKALTCILAPHLKPRRLLTSILAPSSSMERPDPSSNAASRRMARVRQKGTRAELELRRALHGRGLRYHLQVPLLSNPRRVADIVFPSARLAIFVDGCFWHGCPDHASWPKANAESWRNKIERNRERDIDTARRLETLGWRVMRIWAHENAAVAADRISRVVRDRHDTQSYARRSSYFEYRR